MKRSKDMQINYLHPAIYIYIHYYIWRDDLYPFLGGGNKGRKMDYISKDIIAKGCNAVVTTGGIQSNHCRALAILAGLNEWECTLVLHGDRDKFYSQSGNAKVMRQTGAKIIFVDTPEDISYQMDQAMSIYSDQGYNPYYVYGGGHTMEGGLAYIEAVAELKYYCNKIQWYPDYIFLASGTGSTQAGILAGLNKYGLRAKVIGISIARKSEIAIDIITDFHNKLCDKYNIKNNEIEIIITDDYLCGGYEKYNEQIKNISDTSLKRYGFILDTTYSGKAFYGMQEYIRLNHIKGNILFWHTGGIFNFLA